MTFRLVGSSAAVSRAFLSPQAIQAGRGSYQRTRPCVTRIVLRQTAMVHTTPSHSGIMDKVKSLLRRDQESQQFNERENETNLTKPESPQPWEVSIADASDDEKPLRKDRLTLNDFVATDSLMDKTPEEIRRIWLETHETGANLICNVIPADAFRCFARKAADYPQFLYAIPLESGICDKVEFVLGQWNQMDCYFTSAIQSQPVLGSESTPQSAPVAFMIQHFDDLIDSKDIVLVSGEFDPNVFSTRDAQLLYLQLGMYYGRKTTLTQLELLHRFNHDSELFNRADVIEELEALIKRLR